MIRKDEKMAKKTLIEGQCQEVEACLRKKQQQRIPASDIPYHKETG